MSPAAVGRLPACKEWRCWHQFPEGHPFPFGRTPSLTPSRSRSCTSCTASCLWRRAGPGSPGPPPPAESAAAASWTCLQGTTARLGSCSWTCPCSAPSFAAPACSMPCACTAKVGPPSLSASLFWTCLCPSPSLKGDHGPNRVLLPSGLHPALDHFSAPVPPLWDLVSSSSPVCSLLFLPTLLTPLFCLSLPYSCLLHPPASPYPTCLVPRAPSFPLRWFGWSPLPPAADALMEPSAQWRYQPPRAGRWLG